jgi:phage/plasmid-like protein (TIGR03299 family)
MVANVQTMAYHGDVPWHGLGKRVPKGIDSERMIQAAGLDWKVELVKARGARIINKHGDFSLYEVMRVPRYDKGETDDVLLGTVSHRYQPLQNSDAFKFFDHIVRDDRAYFETAGALGGGERIWVMAAMPGAMQIVPGDECLKYLLLSNTHTGEGSVMVKFTSLRVVCQNTLMLALKDGQTAYRVRHSQQMQVKLDELADFVALTQGVFIEAEETFKRLAKVQMTGDRLDSYLSAVFPLSAAHQKNNTKPARWDFLKEIFEHRPDLQQRGVRGTLWGAYNAITTFEDYKRPPGDELPEQRLNRAWFGAGADVKLMALAKATELAAAWR